MSEKGDGKFTVPIFEKGLKAALFHVMGNSDQQPRISPSTAQRNRRDDNDFRCQLAQPIRCRHVLSRRMMIREGLCIHRSRSEGKPTSVHPVLLQPQLPSATGSFLATATVWQQLNHINAVTSESNLQVHHGGQGV